MPIELSANGWVRVISKEATPRLVDADQWDEGYPLPAKGCRICGNSDELVQIVAFVDERAEHRYQCPNCNRFESYYKTTVFTIQK